MDEEAAVIDNILETRNGLISYKTEMEIHIEQKIRDNVNYINDIPEYEKSIENYPELVENTGKPVKSTNYDEAINIEDTKDYLDIRNCLIGFDSKKEIIQNALAIACDKLHCQAAAIFLLSSKDGLLKRVGIKGVDCNNEEIEDSWFEEESYEVGQSFTGKAASSQGNSKYGKTQVLNDFTDDKFGNKNEYFQKLGKLKIAIAMPLNGRNKTYGVLRIINKVDNNKLISADVFDESDVALITFLAGAIAAAISNFHRDAQANILRYLKDSPIQSDLNEFNY
jgi:GAF domain